MIWFLSLLLLTACQRSDPPPPTSFKGYAMTIPYHIMVGEPLSKNEQRQIEATIADLFDRVNATYNRFNPESELTQLNQLPARVKQKISPELVKLLQVTDGIHKKTEGRFDPTVLPLYLFWENALNNNQIPCDVEIAAIKSKCSWSLIHLEEGIFWKECDGVELDLGGIAKGYTIDLLANELVELGRTNFYIEWGGEIFAAGEHPEGRPWTIAIHHPQMNQEVEILPLKDEAIATSGDYLQSWSTKEGREFFHIVNPQTGRFLEVRENSITSATVLAPTCVEADALATASMFFNDVNMAKEWAKRIQEESPDICFWWIQRAACSM